MNRRNILVILAIVPVLLASGCAFGPKKATGEPFKAITVPSGKSVVYFYRSDKFMMSGWTLFMSIPKEANNCFAMDTGGYYAHVADPGMLRVSQMNGHEGTDAVHTYRVTLNPGDVKYVKVDFTDDRLPKSVYEEVPEAQALPEISKYRMIDRCSAPK